MSQGSTDQLRFDGQGLLPAVIQDWLDGTVLMLGYMNEEAIAKTVATRRVHFWSRSRNKLWEKGQRVAVICVSNVAFQIQFFVRQV